jgi:hypothetical protein
VDTALTRHPAGKMIEHMQRDAELLVSCVVVDLVRHASALCCR